MFRKVLIETLQVRPITLYELSLLLDTEKRDLEEDLQHLFRSLRGSSLCPVIEPARCRKCGFRFHPEKLHKPGKCPRCKGTWISEPLIGVEERR
jgi:predicted Zn-ribbon and HTH transcriptional regulator